MSDIDSDDTQPAGAALLERLRAQLAGQLRSDPALFRVVELTRDSRGRLVRQGQIWHTDLNHVRRFGRALAANSVSQQVLIADAAGGVIEQIPVAGGAEAGRAGWGGWRDLPLPPPPARKTPKPARVEARPPPAAALAAASAQPAADAAAIAAAVDAVDAAPMPPAPPVLPLPPQPSAPPTAAVAPAPAGPVAPAAEIPVGPFEMEDAISLVPNDEVAIVLP